MSKSLVVDLEKCTGCRTCEMACSFMHYGEYNPTKSAIQVSIFTENAFFVPVVCFQCKKPFCEEVCPTGALTKNEIDGAFVVLVDVLGQSEAGGAAFEIHLPLPEGAGR